MVPNSPQYNLKGEEKVITTTCSSHCGGFCLLKVHVKAGVITRIETDDGEEPQLRACLRGRAYRQRVYVPRCPHYGRPMCPPNVMPLDDFRKVLAHYKYTLLVQMEMGLSASELRKKYGSGLTLAQLYQSPGHLEDMTASFRVFFNLISRLEAEAFNLGYRFAAGFAAGNFFLGLDQNSQETPFTAWPSMEAMGIDVVETARRAGLPIAFPAEEIVPYYNGLILVD